MRDNSELTINKSLCKMYAAVNNDVKEFLQLRLKDIEKRINDKFKLEYPKSFNNDIKQFEQTKNELSKLKEQLKKANTPEKDSKRVLDYCFKNPFEYQSKILIQDDETIKEIYRKVANNKYLYLHYATGIINLYYYYTEKT